MFIFDDDILQSFLEIKFLVQSIAMLAQLPRTQLWHTQIESEHGPCITYA